MLHAEDISFEVRGAVLLDRLDFDASAGAVVAIIGPNGAGKSTLVRVLAGELAPTRGRVLIDGRDIRKITPGELAARRAVVPQATHLAFPFTAAEVVGLGQSVPGFAASSPARRRLLDSVMAKADVARLAHRPYQSLSGGERQRVHFARALCQLAASGHEGARLLLLDEPTASLDLSHQLILLSEAQRLAREGYAVVAVLHDWNLAARFADTLVVMGAGRIAARGTPAEVFRDAVLSDVFGCHVVCNEVPRTGPFVLPQRCALPDAREEPQ